MPLCGRHALSQHLKSLLTLMMMRWWVLDQPSERDDHDSQNDQRGDDQADWGVLSQLDPAQPFPRAAVELSRRVASRWWAGC